MSSENQMCKLRQLQKDRITDPGSGNRLKVGIHIGRGCLLWGCLLWDCPHWGKRL